MSTTTNFWELLQQRQDELTKSGRAVADYLVHHADEAQYLSISSLARECKVAEATVFRFCRALGFEGYHEMRISLAQANATGALVNQHEPEPGATTASLCEHASGLFLTAINGTQNSLSPEAVEQAVDLMRAARQVFCLGQGGSALLGSRGNAHWRVEGSRPIGSRVKRLAQGELMPASTRTGYYLTQNSQDLRLRRPFPGPRTSSQEGGNLFETDTTQWALRQAWPL